MSKIAKTNLFRFRKASVLVLVSLVFGVFGGIGISKIYALGTTEVLGYATDITVGGLNQFSNQMRADNGLPALAINSELTSAAYAKANYMFANNYWAHNAPDGTTPWDFILGAGYDYINAGENLAKDFSTSSGVVDGWMNSPTHRENLLSSGYNDVGYAIVNGTLLGSETTIVVAMYGSRNAPAPTETVTPTPSYHNVQPVEESVAEAVPIISTPSQSVAADNVEPLSEAVASEPVSKTNQQAISAQVISAEATQPTAEQTGVVSSIRNEAVAFSGNIFTSLLNLFYNLTANLFSVLKLN